MPKPGASPRPSLVTGYTYDTTFNKPMTVTDPLGLVTAMTYDGTTGNPLTTVADAGAAPQGPKRTTSRRTCPSPTPRRR